jgi:hypothetical protein
MEYKIGENVLAYVDWYSLVEGVIVSKRAVTYTHIKWWRKEEELINYYVIKYHNHNDVIKFKEVAEAHLRKLQ